MFRIGLSSCGKPLNEETFEAYRKNGITEMEVSPGMEEYAGLDYKNIQILSKEFGINLWSFHLPFGPFETLDISRPELCESSIEYLSELIKKAADIGIDKYIIHASGEPIEETERVVRMECAKESLARLAEVAKKEGGVMAVEDLPRTCLGRSSDDILELISAHSDLRVCFDTNHLLSENPVDFIHKIGDKIITTHVSDYDFINERHWLPGEGKIDWPALMKALRDVKYNEVWLYEIGYESPYSILPDRPLTCEDFALNAKELFAGEEPTVFRRIKPNLGMWG